ncbi:CTD kinase subunit beta [Sphaceloma murrayae]|uniref:RNA polymerase II holoenzyme cyclin-like subunit n=1 Tax=Sphaceloma murrayae TaxID=2082308 RepID=A0A2K1QP59_9PEZI|nr:CTD kinase subunit beta [Sphaceloma murrayae]
MSGRVPAPCPYWLRGHCTFGFNCKWQHTQVPPSISAFPPEQRPQLQPPPQPPLGLPGGAGGPQSHGLTNAHNLHLIPVAPHHGYWSNRYSYPHTQPYHMLPDPHVQQRSHAVAGAIFPSARVDSHLQQELELTRYQFSSRAPQQEANHPTQSESLGSEKEKAERPREKSDDQILGKSKRAASRPPSATPPIFAPPSPSRASTSPAPSSAMVPMPTIETHENGLYGGIGPHPSYVQVAKPYIFEQSVQRCLETNGNNEARESGNRLQGVAWIESVRKALQLPVRTYMTAVVYYHRFRLAHAESDYMNVDAAAAALFTACKIEDTLKKSRDILCAAYNLKVSLAEQLTPDDSIFEEPSKRLVGLERLMLESSGFDFRNRNPQEWVIKFTRLGQLDRSTVGKTAYRICIDLYRTYAPIKQCSSTMGLACVELAARLLETSTDTLISHLGDENTLKDKWGTSRAEVMETLLDLLELYTHSRGATAVGPEYPIETFIAIRITLNKEATAANLPRYSEYTEDSRTEAPKANGVTTNGTKPSPASPATPLNAPSTVQQSPAQPDSAATASPGLGAAVRTRQAEQRNGTVRYMLDAQRAHSEKDTVASYFKEEWEEYEEVIERPARPTNSASTQSVAAVLDREQERESSRDTSARDRGQRGGRERSRERDDRRDRYKEREWEGRRDGRRERDDERDRHRRDERDRGKDRHRDDREVHRHRDREDDRDPRRDMDRERDRHRERERPRERERERYRR